MEKDVPVKKSYVLKGSFMKKRILQFIFFLFIFSNCIAYHYIFPNEILYQNRSTTGFAYSSQAIDFFINSRFSIDTLFNYKVHDPLLAGLIQTESSFYLHAVSDSNALGLFQMKPFIASEIGALNPFNPSNDKKISSLLDNYTSTFGNVNYALGAYHIGYYGIQKILDSGNNPMNDNRINDYVQKIHSFQRLYKKGDKIPLKDYVWFDFSMSLTNPNKFSSYIVIPEYSLGSLALGIKKENEYKFSFYQDFSLFWFMSAYLGYEDGFIFGFVLKSNDWYDKVFIKYNFHKEDLIWSAGFDFDFLSVEVGFSKTSIFFKPSFVLKDRYFFEIPLIYSDYTFTPGISIKVKF